MNSPRMVRALWVLVLLLISGCAALPSSPQAHHLAVIWLKKSSADAEAAEQQYRQACQALAELPGVLQYSVGRRIAIARTRPNAAVDSSFDLVVHARFTDPSAYQAFLAHPDYLRIAQTQLKPLVERYQVYEYSD